MRSFWKLVMTEMRIVLREPMSVFFTLAFAPMLMGMFGMIFGNKPNSFYHGYGFIDVSVASYMAMTIATAGLMHLPVTVATYREKSILRRLKITPLSPQAILGAQLVVMFLMVMMGTGLLILLGKAVFHLRFAGHVPAVVAGLALSCLSFLTLGFVLAGLAPTARIAQTASMIIYFPMLFLSGAAIPKEVFPPAIKHLSEYLPLTHVISLLSGLWLGRPWSQHYTDVAILAGMLVVGIIISAVTFRWE